MGKYKLVMLASLVLGAVLAAICFSVAGNNSTVVEAAPGDNCPQPRWCVDHKGATLSPQSTIPPTATQQLSAEGLTKEAYYMAGEQHYNERNTAIALHQTATRLTPTAPPPVWPTPEPSPTWATGMVECAYGGASPYQNDHVSCWRGVVNGRLISAVSAVERVKYRPAESAMLVYARPFAGRLMGFDDTRVPGVEAYRPPVQLGLMSIISVNGTQLTLQCWDEARTRYIFDVATRQYISSNGTPLPPATITLPATSAATTVAP